MSARDDNSAREESQRVLEAMERYESLKEQLANARTCANMNEYARLKREVAFCRRELAKLTNEK